MRRSNGHPAGFDVLRLVLAAAVIVQHSVNVTAGQGAADRLFLSPWRGLLEPILPMFFALSGFLVAGSLERCRSIIGFGGLRILRIVPALAAEVSLCALLLGPACTTSSLPDYLHAPAFRSYFLNVVGIIHYRLPGVFAGNPVPDVVNAQLWTVPYELECYLALAMLALLGVTRRPLLFVVLLVVAQGGLLVWVLWAPTPVLEITPQGRTLVVCFLCGVAVFMWRDRIPYRPDLVLLALAALQALLWVRGGSWLLAGPVSYVTVAIGLADLPKPRLLFDGDYSYGMYLYGFPIQQAIVHVWPNVPWTAHVVLSLGLAFLLARVSWWGVERRALRWRPRLHAFETQLLEALPAGCRLDRPVPAPASAR